MNRRLISTITLMITAGVLLLLGLTLFNLAQMPPKERYIPFNHIRGMSVSHQNIPYTLNFHQQTQVASRINSAEPSGMGIILQSEPTTFDFESLTIYRFDGSNFEIVPVGLTEGRLIFSSPELNPEGFLVEQGTNDLKTLLSESFVE